LGLAVVQNLVLNHGGEISCGRSDQGGALFRLRFPIALRKGDLQPVMVGERRTIEKQYPVMRSLS
ncbi:MAG: hypothetical protein AB2707_04480, partial [Candidatus Thiodiazotropha sp.]